MSSKKLPKIKKTISSFLIEEKGQISKQKLLAIGSFLTTASILSLVPEVMAAHTNTISVSWSAGDIQGHHYHHASHASHSSHSSWNDKA